jgi:hypothetical protein
MSVPGPDTRTDRQTSGRHPSSAAQAPFCPGAPAAVLCDRCEWALADGCTCRPKPGVRLAVERRHREAVARAEASGWARAARLLNIGPPPRHRFPLDPTGRGWVA